MRYLLTESEALLLKQKFGFGQLLGLNEKQRVKLGTERQLYNKGVIYSNNGKEELSNEYRALFSTWAKMRYSITRPDLNDRTSFKCVLSNEEISIYFCRDKEIISIDVFDFSANKFDKVIAAFSDMVDVNVAESMFNISMSMDECAQLLQCKQQEEFSVWEKKLGIQAAVLGKFVATIGVNQASLLLVEDHVGDVGYLAKIVNTTHGIYAMKHITHQDKQKMVLLYGGTQSIIDSVYNF